MPSDVPLRRRTALGFPVPDGTSDPDVWDALPGVGPVRARSLAAAAGAGRLRRPADLLQIPGFGTKLSARIAPHIAWRAELDPQESAE